LEFCSKPFRKREKHLLLLNFVPNHSAEDTNARKPICRRKKHGELRNYVANHSAEAKNARNSFPNFFIKEEKNTQNFFLNQ
jgi:hypothetical protein